MSWKRYRKTGSGLLGIVDRVKKPLGGILAGIIILTMLGFAGHDNLTEAQHKAKGVENDAYNGNCLEIDAITKEKEKPAQTGDLAPDFAPYDNDYDNMLYMLCQDHEVNHKLAIGIARLETGHYTSRLFTESNNWGGMKNGSRFYTYETDLAGAVAFVKMLESQFISQGLDTPEKMNPKYAEDPKWAAKVRAIMKERG